MCTRTLWNTTSRGVFVGRTMDWASTTEPKLVVFPRGRRRDGGLVGAQRIVEENQSFCWTSKYASAVASVYGLGAADGLNESGLGAHMLFFTSCDFGDRQVDKPAVQAGLWVQLLLDLAATVDDAVALLDHIDLVMVEAMGFRSTLHVAVEDATGDSAIIEYVGGERKVYQGRDHTIMTNDPPYDQQLELLAQHDFTEATRETPIPGNVNPRDRFVRAAYYCQALPEPTEDRRAVAAIMAIARNVSVPFGAPYKTVGTVYDTEYRTVCDLTNLRYFFELTINPSVMWLSLLDFDLAPDAPVMVLDPDDIQLNGDVTSSFSVLDPVPF